MNRFGLILFLVFAASAIYGEAPGEVKKFGRIEMVFIPAGSFTMGSPESEIRRDNDEKQHSVTLSAFWMGQHEVTQEEYVAVMGTNPSSFKDNPLNPVEGVSWYNAVEFCNKLSEQQGLKPYYAVNKSRKDPLNENSIDRIKWIVTINGGTGYRLPTEAEWEYACRAGTTTVFCYGNSLDSTMANFDDSYSKGEDRKKTLPVGSFKPNAWGLYDMHGNVWEWCFDWHDVKYYERSSVKDPVNLDGGMQRVLRGGSWRSIGGSDLRSANRSWSWANAYPSYYGFRVVRSLQ